MRFADKESHQIFLEPEGITTDEFYINGLSTCLPFEVQIKLVQSVFGCEHAEILRPAYAVEYDFVIPTQIFNTLEVKSCKNLFLAGQINGTSGYEEAAAQGIMAGINAARRAMGRDGISLGREQAYIGVLIDDLVTKGTVEPYRMFTSRAEHRLILRQDNADLRLSQIGYEIGLLPETKYRRFAKKQQRIKMEIQRLARTRHNNESLLQLLKRPEVNYTNLPQADTSLPPDVIQQVEIEVKYAGYIDRQRNEVERLKNLEGKQIPPDFDFAGIPSLRLEARQKLAKFLPRTIGQASRISGVSPADISLLLVWLKRHASNTTEDDFDTSSGGDCD